MSDGYKKELEFLSSVDSAEFPDFLFNPLYNDFGNDYYEIGTSSDPLIMKARSIGGKYSDFFKYIQALEDYNEYMELLEEKYGSISIIKNVLKQKRKAEDSGDQELIDSFKGIAADIIPPKPIAKNKKSMREFLRAGIIPSKKLKKDVDDESLISSAKTMYPDNSDIQIDIDESMKKAPKRIRKSLNKSSEAIAAKNRRANLYSKYANNNGADFVIEYINGATHGDYNTHGEFTSDSLHDIVKEEERRASMNPDIYEDEMMANVSVISGYGGGERLIKRSELQQIEIAKELYSIGIDVTGNMSKSMGKDAVKVIRRAIGYENNYPMTKKELKKRKKRQKKENRRLESRRDNDKMFNDILLRNKFSFSKDGNNLSFSLKDVMKEDD